LAVVQVGREGGEPFRRQFVGDALDVGVEAPPLLHHDHRGSGPFMCRREVSVGSAAVARELHVVTHGREPYPANYPAILRWSQDTTSSMSMRTATRLATMKLMCSSPWSGP